MNEQTLESNEAQDTAGETPAAIETRERRHGPGRRFVKGISGNPAGRPPGRRATGARGDRLPGADQPTRAMILEEAYRMVRVEDADGEIEMPANQAVFRALTAAAMRGNQLAQQRWTAIVRLAEQEQEDAQVALFNMLERGGVNERYCAEQRGYVPLWTSDDDILIDGVSGVAVVRPMSGESEDEA